MSYNKSLSNFVHSPPWCCCVGFCCDLVFASYSAWRTLLKSLSSWFSRASRNPVKHSFWRDTVRDPYSFLTFALACSGLSGFSMSISSLEHSVRRPFSLSSVMMALNAPWFLLNVETILFWFSFKTAFSSVFMIEVCTPSHSPGNKMILAWCNHMTIPELTIVSQVDLAYLWQLQITDWPVSPAITKVKAVKAADQSMPSIQPYHIQLAIDIILMHRPI